MALLAPPPPAPVGAPGGAMMDAASTGMAGAPVGETAFKIDGLCKQLAAMVPTMAPFLGQFVSDLRLQLGAALRASNGPALGGPDTDFPDGSSRLSM